MPMREGVNFVHNALIGINARDRIRLGASGKIATAFDIPITFASLLLPIAASGLVRRVKCTRGACAI